MTIALVPGRESDKVRPNKNVARRLVVARLFIEDVEDERCKGALLFSLSLLVVV